MIRRAIAAFVCALTLTSVLAVQTRAAEPFGVQVTPPHVPDSTVSATVQLRDVLPDRFRKLVENGGVLHLRVQAELWQSRPTWDRLVYPAIVRVLRLVRGQAGRGVTVTSADGAVSTYVTMPNPMPIVVEIGGAERLSASDRYYVHTVATLGTLDEREADSVSDAIFGRESETGTLGSLGRVVFRKVLQVSDYLQSVSAEARSGTLPGQEILRRK
jgi:hypothetical protein